MCAAVLIKVCDGVIVLVDVRDIVRVHVNSACVDIHCAAHMDVDIHSVPHLDTRVHVNSACPYVPHSEYHRVRRIGVHVIMCGTANMNVHD